MRIFCAGCGTFVEARRTTGEELYPRREDLAFARFFVCDTCGAFVGTHKGVWEPLGCLATPEIKRWRKQIHALLDPLWHSGKISRKRLYKRISREIGHEYHTGDISSAEEGKRIYEVVKAIKDELDPGPWNR
jgi:hypothetical protein